MDPLGIARWQFGITTVYHFLFVPITIGMAYFIAITETAWVRTRNPIYLRAAKFWGKIFLINPVLITPILSLMTKQRSDLVLRIGLSID